MKALLEREAGPDAHEHRCAGGCGCLVEGADLCDPCHDSYEDIGDREWPDVRESDRTWFEGVNAVLDGDADGAL